MGHSTRPNFPFISNSVLCATNTLGDAFNPCAVFHRINILCFISEWKSNINTRAMWMQTKKNCYGSGNIQFSGLIARKSAFGATKTHSVQWKNTPRIMQHMWMRINWVERSEKFCRTISGATNWQSSCRTERERQGANRRRECWLGRVAAWSEIMRHTHAISALFCLSAWCFCGQPDMKAITSIFGCNQCIGVTSETNQSFGLGCFVVSYMMHVEENAHFVWSLWPEPSAILTLSKLYHAAICTVQCWIEVSIVYSACIAMTANVYERNKHIYLTNTRNV